MSPSPPDQPPGNILSMMTIDVFATKSSGEITILHDQPFARPLDHLEYNSENKELLFVFDDNSQRSYGEPIKETIGAHMSKAEEATFFQMDMEKKQPVNGFTVPIKQVTYI